MKKPIVWSFLLLWAAMSEAQPPDTVWTRTHDLSTTYESPVAMALMPDGGSIVAGSAYADSMMYLFRFDALGNLLWSHIGGDGSDVIPVDDDGFLIAGNYSTEFQEHSSLVHTDNVGNMLWAQTYDMADAVDIDTAHGEIYELSRYSYISEYFHVVRAQSNGDTLWTRIFVVDNVAVGGLVPLPDSGCAVSFLTRQASPSYWGQPTIYRIDAAGDTVWSYSYPLDDFETVSNVLLRDDGDLVFAASRWRPEGYHLYLVQVSPAGILVSAVDAGILGRVKRIAEVNGTGYAMQVDNHLVRTTPGGQLLWQQQLPNVRYVDFEAADSGYVLVGRFRTSSPDDSINTELVRLGMERPLVIDTTQIAVQHDSLVITVATKWEHEVATLELWRSMDPNGPYELLFTTSSTGDFLEGTTHVFVDTSATPEQNYCYYLGATNTDGRRWEYRDWTVCGDISAAGSPPTVPREFAFSAYPNPFNSTVTLSLSLPTALWARLALYDVTGREVAELADRRFDAGTNRLRFDAGNLPSGVYFAAFNVEHTEHLLKLLLIK